MVLVFDLDDTLYEEITFVRSGFRAVARYLGQAIGVPVNDAFAFMWNELETHGRGRVFDRVLRHYQVYNKARVKRCLWVYRTHRPDIQLTESARQCIRRFRETPKYIVTDGHKDVQRNKMRVLSLYADFDQCIATYGYGVRHSKPSPHVFRHICNREKVQPNQVVYVGDNPKKDFVGIKPLGFKTIRILQGPCKSLQVSAEYDAHVSIRSLDELQPPMLQSLTHSE